LHIDGLLADLSVTAQEGQLLAFVSARDGVPVRAILRLLGVPKSTGTSLLKRLETAGLTRRRSDPDDARSWLVFATTRGRRVGAVAREHVLDFERRIQAHLAQADLDALVRIVDAVSAETGINLPSSSRRAILPSTSPDGASLIIAPDTRCFFLRYGLGSGDEVAALLQDEERPLPYIATDQVKYHIDLLLQSRLELGLSIIKDPTGAE
jgi:DNA-binding MarR family transcriptional regulator